MSAEAPHAEYNPPMVKNAASAGELLDIEKIKNRREELRLSQQEAAELAGFTAGRQQWNSIERGARASITLDTLGKIAKALSLQPAELILQIPILKKPRKGK